ncbi:hypothetical protein H5395_16250 [Paracoccus sp. MC1854]|uniref:hypothetical protein n=1 Tax=Paracoccus sp. MC1854 TaxID=2760306 RepID=UPI0016035BBF|nr:hypothetical protein [Paracoccus sp. MC1854]MBB1493028.1 hypothetical protein [Paracoccus sp. MC1854]
MIELEPDVEVIRYERRKAILRSAWVMGFVFLATAAYYFNTVGLPDQWWPIAYVVVGTCLLMLAACMTFSGWVLAGGSKNQ